MEKKRRQKEKFKRKGINKASDKLKYLETGQQTVKAGEKKIGQKRDRAMRSKVWLPELTFSREMKECGRADSLL